MHASPDEHFPFVTPVSHTVNARPFFVARRRPALPLISQEDAFLDVYSKWRTSFPPSRAGDVRDVLLGLACHAKSGDGVFWRNLGLQDVADDADEETVAAVTAMCCDLLAAVEARVASLSEEGGAPPDAHDMLSSVKHRLLSGLEKCMSSGGDSLSAVIVDYDLFAKSLSACVRDPSSTTASTLLRSYPVPAVKALLQSPECLQAAAGMLEHEDGRVRDIAGEVWRVSLSSR